MNQNDKITDIQVRVARIEEKLDDIKTHFGAVSKECKKNTQFRHVSLGIISFLVTVSGLFAAYSFLWK